MTLDLTYEQLIKCTDYNHDINNSWGSLRQFGYCAVCSKCMAIFTPRDIKVMYENNYNISGSISGNSLENIMREKGLIE